MIGDGGRRKINTRNLRDPTGCTCRQGMTAEQRTAGRHNRRRPGRESEGGIVARKRGNSRGAKAPCQIHALHQNVRRTAWTTRPTTERSDGCRDDLTNLRTQPERKSGVVLPPKVSELRRKLGQKAKQEPKFRFYALYDRIYRLDVLTAAWWLVLGQRRRTRAWTACRVRTSLMALARRVFLDELHEELRTNRYRPQPVKRVYISRSRTAGRDRWGFPRSRTGSSKRRRCWCSSRSSRRTSWTVPYGFRPGRNAHQAIDAIRQLSVRRVHGGVRRGPEIVLRHDPS